MKNRRAYARRTGQGPVPTRAKTNTRQLRASGHVRLGACSEGGCTLVRGIPPLPIQPGRGRPLQSFQTFKNRVPASAAWLGEIPIYAWSAESPFSVSDGVCEPVCLGGRRSWRFQGREERAFSEAAGHGVCGA